MYTCLTCSTTENQSVGKFHVSFLERRSKTLVKQQTNKFCKRIRTCMMRKLFSCTYVQHNERQCSLCGMKSCRAKVFDSSEGYK